MYCSSSVEAEDSDARQQLLNVPATDSDGIPGTASEKGRRKNVVRV